MARGRGITAIAGTGLIKLSAAVITDHAFKLRVGRDISWDPGWMFGWKV